MQEFSDPNLFALSIAYLHNPRLKGDGSLYSFQTKCHSVLAS